MLEQCLRLPLRNVHHLWHPRAVYLTDPLTTLFRNLVCSTVDINYAAHGAIHGRNRIPRLWPGLYLPPVMPAREVMEYFVARHAGRVPCRHPRRLVAVNVFALTNAPWDETFGQPCAYIEMDADMFELVQAHYLPNERANAAAHIEYLTKRHNRKKCTCHFPVTVRHVRANNQKAAA